MTSYPIESSDNERARLASQAELLRPFTERLLRNAGGREGSAVLDLGTGAGDVALLTAAIVGPTGRIVSIDRDANHLAHARSRAVDAGLSNITFVQGDIAAPPADLSVDIAIGRYVLMYQSDPVAAVRGIAKVVKPGGTIAFHELNMHEAARGDMWPIPPQGAGRETVDAGLLSRVQNHMGVRLPEVFATAGLDISEWGFEGASPMSPLTARREGFLRVVESERKRRRALSGKDDPVLDEFERWWREAPAFAAILQPPAVLGWARKPR